MSIFGVNKSSSIPDNKRCVQLPRIFLCTVKEEKNGWVLKRSMCVAVAFLMFVCSRLCI